MNLDEAIAVYLYLKDQHHRSMDERLQFEEAWEIIVRYARESIRAGRIFTPQTSG